MTIPRINTDWDSARQKYREIKSDYEDAIASGDEERKSDVCMILSYRLLEGMTHGKYYICLWGKTRKIPDGFEVRHSEPVIGRRTEALLILEDLEPTNNVV